MSKVTSMWLRIIAYVLVIVLASLAYENRDVFFPYPTNGKIYYETELMTVVKVAKSTHSGRRGRNRTTVITLHLQPENSSSDTVKVTLGKEYTSHEKGDVLTVYYIPGSQDYRVDKPAKYTDDPNHPNLLTDKEYDNYTYTLMLTKVKVVVIVICIVLIITELGNLIQNRKEK